MGLLTEKSPNPIPSKKSWQGLINALEQKSILKLKDYADSTPFDQEGVSASEVCEQIKAQAPKLDGITPKLVSSLILKLERQAKPS